MKLNEIVIEAGPIATQLRGSEGITEVILQTLLDFLCGRFQGVLPNVGPPSDFRTTRTTGDKGVISGSFTVTFSDEFVAATLAAVKRYWNPYRVHESIPLKVEFRELYSAPRVEP